MSEGRQFCCCGVQSWTKVIAWLEIIISVISIIMLIIGTIVLVGDGQSEFRELLYKLYIEYGYDIIFGVLVIGFVMSLVNLFMGIILLMGAYKRNACYVKAWLIYTIICVSLNIITRFATMSMATIGPELIGMLFGLAIVMFVLWAVWEFKKEIEMDNMRGSRATYKA